MIDRADEDLVLLHLQGDADDASAATLAARLAEEPGLAELLVRRAVIDLDLEAVFAAAAVKRRPRRFLGWAAAAALLVGVGLWFAVPRTPLAVISGLADIRRGDARLPARDGLALQEGDRVETVTGSSTLTYPDGTRVVLAPRTRVVLVESSDGAKVVALEAGSLKADVAPQTVPMRFSTATAEATVLGTRLALAARPRGARLEVESGRVRLRRLRDGANVEVPAGHLAVAEPGGVLAARRYAPLVAGRWTKLALPVAFPAGSGGVLSFAVDPRDPLTLYAGVEAVAPGAGLWRSRDGGATWAVLGAPDPDPSDDAAPGLDVPLDLAVDPADPARLYAAQGLRGPNHGFWVSEDAGRTWTRTLRESLGTLAPDPSDFRHVLAGTHSSDALGLFESRDAGRTWKRHAAPTTWASNSSALGFLFHPASGRGDEKTWLVHSHGLWRTADAGATWTKVGDEPIGGGIGDGLGAVYTTDGTLYKTAESRVLRSRDNGVTWERIDARLPHSAYRAIAADGRHLYLAPDGYPPESGWLRSEESDGAAWTEPPGSPRPERGPLRLRFDPERRILYSANWSAGLWALRVPD